MRKVKEISLFTVGDAHQLSTWSNVPYLFSKALTEKGIKVNHVNVEESTFLNSIYKYSVFVFLKLISKDTRHTYFRSGLNTLLTRRKIKNAIKNYKSSQVNIFLTFSFSSVDLSGTHQKPCVLFGDWTYLYFIKHFLMREPKWFEKKALEREKQNINGSQLVLGLFPLSATFIKTNFHQKNCHYLGNVINANHVLNEGLLDKKINSKKIIFIGNRKYLIGAKQLIFAFKQMSLEAELHLIGLTEADTGERADKLYQYGYLDKGDPEENEKYYQLLSEASLIVNTHEGWGAISSVIEAMYFYTAVITTPYNEFTETFGKEISFGDYLTPGSDLTKLMDEFVALPAIKKTQLMQNAHDRVKDFTWERYSDELIKRIEPLV